MAEKFRRPVIIFIDTPAAYPGIESEERGVAEAIALNLREMAMLDTSVIVVICGEGGSGGALGIAVGDRVLIQEFAVYSVIPPEGCAAILWRDANRKVEAAEALKITAPDLLALDLVDEIVKEPLGGAHLDYDRAAALVDEVVTRHLTEVGAMTPTARLDARYAKFRAMGRLGQSFVDEQASLAEPGPRKSKSARAD
jgi:acetyl-CoA carboxylase carboxyl transferase subunit alpha